MAETLFNKLDVDVYYVSSPILYLESTGTDRSSNFTQLEYDDDRSGDFKPLRYVPSNKFVVLGLITTKHGQLEDADKLKRRVYEAADILARGSGKTRDEALEQ